MEKIKNLFKRSLKPIETEEPLTLVIFRPIGFIIAFLLNPTPISANAVSLVSMIFGILAGYCFFKSQIYSPHLGALFLFIAHTLDCTDGQLARIRKTSSRMGKNLDGLADVITYISIFTGVAYAISYNGLNYGIHWCFYGIFSILNFLIHINLYDHFKNELIHYSIPEYQDKLEGVAKLKRIYRNLGKSIPAIGYKIILSFYIAFYIIEEAVIRLSLPNNYKGFIRWYLKDKNISQPVKDHFRNNYRRYNLLLVRGWSMLGATTHISIFIVCALVGRMDMIFWIICVPLNIWTLILIICQRYITRRQLIKAFQSIKQI